jgi:CheY-like chemotaxis protein
LLDWNLPGIRGEQILEHLKNDKRLRAIPVVIFTSSSSPADRLRATQLGAARFITKPLDIDDFFNVIAGLEDFVKAPGR